MPRPVQQLTKQARHGSCSETILQQAFSNVFKDSHAPRLADMRALYILKRRLPKDRSSFGFLGLCKRPTLAVAKYLSSCASSFQPCGAVVSEVRC